MTSIDRRTEFSPCRRWRYTLWREWTFELVLGLAEPMDVVRLAGYLLVIGLNPSTADETRDDPTIRRCIDFAKRWGFGALCMANLFAWRETSPRKMKQIGGDAQGPDNDDWLFRTSRHAGMVLAAWGRDGRHLGRAKTVMDALAIYGVPVHALKVNQDGTPQHPLYLPADTQPIPYTLP